MVLMQKNVVSTIVVVLCLTFLVSTCIGTCLGTSSSSELPVWEVGDWWKQSITVSGEASLVGTYTITVVDDSAVISQNGQDYTCYELVVSGGGTIHGAINGLGLSGTWTTTEHHYYTTADQSWVKISSTYDETVTVYGAGDYEGQSNTVTSRLITETVYNPPFESTKGYPLSVGKSWTATTTETKQTQTTIAGETESETKTDSYTKNYLVTQTESVTVSAGEFETYVTRRTDPDGAYAETFYSPVAGFDVKQIEYDSTGNPYLTLELTDYNYSPTGNGNNPSGNDTADSATSNMFVLLIVASVISVTALIVVILLLTRTGRTVK
jgi:hypothetical protein